MRRITALLSVSVAVTALFSFGTARCEVVEEIAAWVNGEIITRSDLLERERVMVSQLSAKLVGDDLDRELTRMRGSLLTDMIRESVLMQRAEILGLELDKVYQQALNNLKEQQGIKSNEDLEKVLKQEGITREELRTTLLRYNVPDIMVNLEVRDKIVVTDAEVSDYFEKNKEQFRVNEEFSVREIVLTPDGRTPEELDELATTVMEELRGGTPFTELVVKYSKAPSRFAEGLIGPFKKGDLAPDIEAVALALEPGQVGEPIHSQAGVHIIKLESHTLPKDPDLEDARKTIVSQLKQDRFAKALDDYFKMLSDTNRIVVNPVYKQYAQTS